MLSLVTFLVPLVLVSAYQQGTYRPSAHLEGGVSAARDYPKGHVITEWNLGHAKSHAVGGFQYYAGELTVPFDGRYYVYAQIYFTKRPHHNSNRVAVYADDRLLLMIHKGMSPGKSNTGFTGGVFVLKKGDQISVKVIGFDTRLWPGPSHSYFGAYLI